MAAFRETIGARALTHSFSQPSELREALLHHLLQLVRQMKSAVTSARGLQGSGKSPKWQNSGNLFWLGYDLMWTQQISLQGLPPSEVIRGLISSNYHLSSLGLGDSFPGSAWANC
jgi:hypothetical protein